MEFFLFDGVASLTKGGAAVVVVARGLPKVTPVLAFLNKVLD